MSRHACIKERNMVKELDRYYFLLMMLENALARRTVKTERDRDQFVFNPKQPSQFMLRVRERGNFLVKTMWSKLPKPVIEELVRRKRIVRLNRNECLVSPKFVAMVESLATLHGKQYCYTCTSGLEIAGALTKWWGMKNITGKTDAFDSAHVDAATGQIVGLPKGNNFIIFGGLQFDHTKRLTDIYNSPHNIDGSYIRLVIATKGFYEGLDLKALRYVHLAEPLPSAVQESQAIGRGVRNCNHVGLPANQRTVTIVRWFSGLPVGGWARMVALMTTRALGIGKVEQLKDEYDRLGGKGYDETVYHRVRTDKEYLVLYNFEQIMKSAAIDCQVLSKYHSFSCSTPKLTSRVALDAGTRCS